MGRKLEGVSLSSSHTNKRLSDGLFGEMGGVRSETAWLNRN